MYNPEHTLKRTFVDSSSTYSFLRALPASTNEVIWNSFTVSKETGSEIIRKGATAVLSLPRSIYDYSSKKVDDSIKIVTACLNHGVEFCDQGANIAVSALKAYNPMSRMMRSENVYIRESSRFIQEQFNTAFMYLLKKPKRLAKLLVALGVPVHPDALTAIMLEDSADKVSNFSIKEFEKAIQPDKFLAKNQDKNKAKMLLAILKCPAEAYDKSTKILIDKLTDLLEATLQKNFQKVVSSSEMLRPSTKFTSAQPEINESKKPVLEKPSAKPRRRRKYYRA